MKKILILHTGGTIAMKENILTGGVSQMLLIPDWMQKSLYQKMSIS